MICRLFLTLWWISCRRSAGLQKIMKLTCGGFLCYGFFAGIVVPAAGFFPASIVNYAVFLDKVGVPVQLFRTFCAVALAYSVMRILSIFEWENGGFFKEGA
jgi:hypothetical protein